MKNNKDEHANKTASSKTTSNDQKNIPSKATDKITDKTTTPKSDTTEVNPVKIPSNHPSKSTHEKTTKKPKSSLIKKALFILILLIIFLIGVIFCYQRNIANFKNYIDTHYPAISALNLSNLSLASYTSLIMPKNDSRLLDDTHLEKTKKDVLPQITHKKTPQTISKKPLEQRPTPEKKIITHQGNHTNSQAIIPNKSNLLLEMQNPTEENAENTLNTDVKQDLASKKLAQIAQETHNAMTLLADLTYNLYQGTPYLNILIDTKSKLNQLKLQIPTLTEYASGGFPTDIIIAADAQKILENVAIMQSRQLPANTIDNIISKFIIVTPTSDIKGFPKILNEIKIALKDADFETASKKINTLSQAQQKPFLYLKKHIQDKIKIHNELKLLNKILIDNIFKNTSNTDYKI